MIRSIPFSAGKGESYYFSKVVGAQGEHRYVGCPLSDSCEGNNGILFPLPSGVT